MTQLHGKKALVTGASRGMGRATALALAAAGAEVLVHYSFNEKAANTVVEEIIGNGGKAHAVAADLRDIQGTFDLSERVREITSGKLDILVANAGIARPARLEDTTVADFDDMFAVNVKAPFFLVQQLSPIMGAGSSIILTSSLATRTTVGDLSAYAASKGAISTLVTHFAAELGSRGIRVNAIAPGVVATDMSSFVETTEGQEFTLGIQAIKRVATPEDIAGVIVFLAGDDARWVTGDVIRADGGSKL
ncbi:SDR family NAD(P)-dependent oxidoreductase [Beijerinckia indica]|uniref:Short-chain dehydrogenase/reductase SDR n=1 Tax=Beijerinckia indica subsp. indica (strain ATCC 9039 / DSM 1715 / NCIMB 8712) TaxID=395963 RepID=B2IKQ5_BEII9|nr:SDR family oxidoreductase [Beijerinckia indica]ACB95094.1 short-chain dehydrogenase/reductase SDR [Beijerinckia indica subsp. indica ATCC 9039]